MTSPTTLPPVSQTNSIPVDNPWGITEAPPSPENLGETMPTPQTLQQEHDDPDSGLKTCGHITLEAGRYPAGFLAGTVLVGPFVPMLIGYLGVSSFGCVCGLRQSPKKRDDGTSSFGTRMISRIYVNIMGFCFRGFKSEEKCREDCGCL